MYRDFIIKQQSPYDSQFKSKTLVGNWYEQRCNPTNDYGSFYKERKLEDGAYLHQEKFMNSSANWANFQQYKPEQTFATEYRDNYKNSEDQKRLSVLSPFITRQSEFDIDKKGLENYRETWTKSNHIFDKSRTYLGTEKGDK